MIKWVNMEALLKVKRTVSWAKDRLASLHSLLALPKKLQRDIGVQPEYQKSKEAKLLKSSFLCEIFRLNESEFLSHPALYSSLVRGLKV